MKIVINYDLINKVREAKGKFSLSKDKIRVTKATLIVYPFTVLLAHMTGMSLKESLTSMTLIDGIFYLLRTNIYNDINRESAIKDLKELSKLLKQLDLNTSGELLLDTVQHQRTQYCLRFDEKRRPHLIQTKALLVTGNNLQNELIIQEHEMHPLKEKPYVLTKGSLFSNSKQPVNSRTKESIV